MPKSDPPLTVLLRAWRRGEPDALDRLMPAIHQQIRVLAAAYLRRERKDHTLSTGDLVSEAFVRLLGGEQPEWQDRAHFFGIAARLMRQVLVDHARRRASDKRGSGERPLPLSEALAADDRNPEALIALDSALSALAAEDERRARVIELVYFAGMSQQEVAHVLGVHTNTVARELKLGQAWLARLLGAT
jgi:RNA polymerase sigma factor (TIGR02999 family)